ncbi:metallophosphoesterase [Paenibacillus sp. J2TS4]|uniref:metallophosphoesterase family protein n=1 Tax=Paenibacillus sp. J2TS4 TaxID=2807194 RepID=UPI001B15DFD7|nr:metallophosphoesterase [Paenibacillus sp. J2TS4]GIP34615.1 hypothetical protein J2TS4_38250 [Paenibacillus sp. J2TS4]
MKLALLGDLHYPRLHHGTPELIRIRDRFYSGMLRQFALSRADVYISLGDLTNEGVPEELSGIMELWKDCSPGNKLVHVIGNHDAYSLPKSEIRTYTRQERYYSVDTDEAVLLIVDTAREMNPRDWGGFLDSEQLDWLDAKIIESASKPVLVFAHHPVYDTTSRSTQDKLSVHPKVDIWSILKKKKGYGFYFNGHNHQNSICRRDQWHFIQTAACLDIPGYRLVEIKDGLIQIQLVRLIDDQMLEQAESLGLQMVYFHPMTEALGQSRDWNLTISLTDSSAVIGL